MPIDLRETVNPIEVAWVLYAIYGISKAWLNYRNAKKDQEARDRSGRNGLLKLTADGAVKDQRLVVGALVAELLLGVGALLSPQNQTNGNPTIGAMFGPWLLIITIWALVTLSAQQAERRVRMNEELMRLYSSAPNK